MTSRECVPLHAVAVNMMEGLDDAKEDQHFNDNPKIMPLFKVDIVKALMPYFGENDKEDEVQVDDKTLTELRLQQEAMEREMQVSQRVHASALEELNRADIDAQPKTVLIAKEMQSADKEKLTELL